MLSLGRAVLRCRPLVSPLIAALVMLALFAALSVFSPSSADAQAGVNGANSLAISPADKEIHVGATASVELVSMPPPESLAVWAIKIVFDPAVVSVDSCTPAASPPSPPRSVFVSACETDDQEGGPDEETVVVVGALLFLGTERGFDDETTLASITFSAVGAIGECSDLTINVVSHLGPDPAVPETNPTTTNGEICVVTDLWGDADCDDTVGTRDGQALLRNVLQQPALSQTQPCPLIGTPVTVDGLFRIWGDWDCDGTVGTRDSQALLRKVLQQPPLSQEGDCPPIGASVLIQVESPGFDGFRAFASHLGAAFEAGDVGFWSSRAVIDDVQCTGDATIGQCAGEPAGTTFSGLWVGTWRTDAIALQQPSSYESDMVAILSSAQPDMTDGFGSGEARIYAIAQRDRGLCCGGDLADSHFLAIGSLITNATGTKGSPASAQRTTIVLEFVFLDGEWRLSGNLYDGLAEFLMPGCAECEFERWELVST